MFDQLNNALQRIREDAFCGTQVPKRLIPREYRVRYGVRNLWKYDLPDGWRLLYSIEAEEVIAASIILEWAGHQGYERRFRY